MLLAGNIYMLTPIDIALERHILIQSFLEEHSIITVISSISEICRYPFYR